MRNIIKNGWRRFLPGGLCIGAVLAANSVRAQGWTVPTAPDVSPIIATATTIFTTGATLGLTILGLGVVVAMLKAGVGARKGKA
jgi:hypothetical protein